MIAALIAPFLILAAALVCVALQYRNLSWKYVALKQDTSVLRSALRTARDRINEWPIEDVDTCMCGSPVNGHGIGDGHSPVSMGDYARHTIVEEITKALGE